MGLQSTFFVLASKEISRVLGGWREPAPLLESPVERKLLNPFTDQVETYWTRQNPDQPEADGEAVEAPKLTGADARFVWQWVTEYELAEIMVAAGIVEVFDEAMEECSAERMNGPANA